MTKRPESQAYVAGLQWVRQHLLDGVAIENFSNRVCFTAEIAEYLDGMYFEYKSQIHYDQAAVIAHDARRTGVVHPGVLRFDSPEWRIHVRRPNCTNCGELYADHTRTGKCLFMSTYYSDEVRENKPRRAT